jgi:hypothetical protein
MRRRDCAAVTSAPVPAMIVAGKRQLMAKSATSHSETSGSQII